MKLSQLLFVAASCVWLASCNCGNSYYSADVKPIQKSDKQLTCKDVVLEINEAEFYKKSAIDRKHGRIEDLIFPYCYPTGYLNANSTEKASESRLEYLNQIYDLLDCDAKSRFDGRKIAPPPIGYQDMPPPAMSMPSAPGQAPHSSAPTGK